MQLSVIIVNYNVKNLLRDCLLSVQKAAHSIDTEIIVVDNASSDGSVEMLKTEFKDVKTHCQHSKPWIFKGQQPRYSTSTRTVYFTTQP